MGPVIAWKATGAAVPMRCIQRSVIGRINSSVTLVALDADSGSAPQQDETGNTGKP